MSTHAMAQPSAPPPLVNGEGSHSILQTAIRATEARLPEVQMFELHQRQAKLFALSGLFADIKGQSTEEAIAKAFVKIDLGESMGLSAAESMTGIDLIQGRVAISANIRASRMQRAGYDWDILQLDEKGCRLQLKFKGQILMREDENGRKVPAVISFTQEDATKAGLIGKDMFKKYPPNMYFARAITNAQRWYAPGVLSLNILSSEEAAADLDAPAVDDSRDNEVQRLFAYLEYTNRQCTQALAKYAGRPAELIDWLEKQVAKKQNDGSQPKEAEKSPAKEADTAPAATAEKSTPTDISTTREPTPDPKPAEQPKTASKQSAPPPTVDEW